MSNLIVTITKDIIRQPIPESVMRLAQILVDLTHATSIEIIHHEDGSWRVIYRELERPPWRGHTYEFDGATLDEVLTKT